MRILCAYNTTKNLEPETYRALILYGVRECVQVDFVDVSGDLNNYWKAIRERWTGEEDLVTVEQDNVITAETMPSFQACEKDWCVFSYCGWPGFGAGGQYTHSLGCTRFSAGLQRKITHEMIAGPELPFHAIDYRMEILFGIHGFESHVHGEVKHLHDYANDPHFQKTNIEILPDGRIKVTVPQPDGTFKIFIE